MDRAIHIISMIDGKPYKTLKRHLSAHGLTPAEYRVRYKLPNDYPTVARGYSEQRREVAKRLGLGRRPAVPAPVKSKDALLPALAEAPAKTPAPKKLAASKAKSAAPTKGVTVKPAPKPRKAAKGVPAAAKVSETTTKLALGRPRKAVPCGPALKGNPRL